jgi:hypothetical protein
MLKNKEIVFGSGFQDMGKGVSEPPFKLGGSDTILSTDRYPKTENLLQTKKPPLAQGKTWESKGALNSLHPYFSLTSSYNYSLNIPVFHFFQPYPSTAKYLHNKEWVKLPLQIYF